MSIKVFSADYLDDLTQQASLSARRRQHRNIHTTYSDPCQRLFNAIEPDSYLQPHRHGTSQGAETMIAIRGAFQLVTFDDEGLINEVQIFGAGRTARGDDYPIGIEIPPGCWHTIISLEPGAILLEIKGGPFDPMSPKFPAPWAPIENSPDSAGYFRDLLEAVTKRLIPPQR